MTIKVIRTLREAGVLAPVAAREPKRDFRRFNLIYGFNGSGKSTLSRIFSCLQSGAIHDGLPENCAFEIELQDGTVLASPEGLKGFEGRICVFNEDFIDKNLRWAEGKATSIFYISQAQADLADKLKEVEGKIPARREALKAETKLVAEREKTFATYKRERAKTVSGALHLGNRRFEAGQLKTAYETLTYDKGSVLVSEALNSLGAVAQRSSPPPALPLVEIGYTGIQAVVDGARYFATVSVGTVLLKELEEHPTMARWLMHGHEYHAEHDLKECLLCGNPFSASRKVELAQALDGRISHLATEIDQGQTQLLQVMEAFGEARQKQPHTNDLALSLQPEYTKVAADLEKVLGEAWQQLFVARDAIGTRKAEPTKVVANKIPDAGAVADLCERLRVALVAVNELIGKHNQETVDFGKVQEDARETITRHFLADGDNEYRAAEGAVQEAEKSARKIDEEIAALEKEVAELRARVQEHGPAADKITKLVRAYLGHGELTIYAADEGYELHRHGKLVKGPPSEGEKTAIALCYFLSTLEAEGRAIKDLTVVVDDPISSLDTKAMNYACTLIRSSLAKAKQVIVLTHNQHCMNEFKKAWRGQAYPDDPAKASATLSYIDVTVAKDSKLRSARIVEMPALLRVYDSEYHFLCQKLFEFEAAGQGHSDYHFMMPNVLRRVLEIFLAFKVPGTDSLKGKLASLCQDYEELDDVRIAALERLVQVESHSDNLDDLIGHSSMTIEEARDASAALLTLMGVADDRHEKAIRKQCKPAA